MAETNLYVKSVQPFDTGKAPKSNSTNTIISESMDQWIIQAIWVYGIWYLSLEQTDQTVTASCLCQTKHMLLPQDIAINTQITRFVLHFSIFSQAAFFYHIGGSFGLASDSTLQTGCRDQAESYGDSMTCLSLEHWMRQSSNHET